MIGGSLQQIIAGLSSAPTQQLYAMTKDPTMGYLAATELRARNQKREQMQPTQAPPPATVVDQDAQKAMQAESIGIMSGIPQVPVQQMARGGLVSFSRGGEPSEMELRAKAQQLATERNIPYDVAYRQIRAEADRESLRFLDPAMRWAKGLVAGTKDIVSLPARGVMGAANQLVRGANALGADIPYIPETAFPGGDSSAMFPYTDRYMGLQANVPSANVGAQAGFVGEAAAPANPYQLRPEARDAAQLPPRIAGAPGAGNARGAGIASLTSQGPGFGKLPGVIQPQTYFTDEQARELERRNAELTRQAEENLPKAPSVEEELNRALSYRDWLDKQNPQDPDVIAAKERTRKRLAELEGNKQNNIRQGWIEAGLGMLASTSPYFGVGIGEGGLKGTRVFRDLQQQDATRIDALSREQMAAGLAEQQRKAEMLRAGAGMAKDRYALEERDRAARAAHIEQQRKDATLPLDISKNRAAIDLQASQGAHFRNLDALGPEKLAVDRAQVDAYREGNRLRAAAAAGGGDDDWRVETIYQRAIKDAYAGSLATDKANVQLQITRLAAQNKVKLTPEQMEALVDKELLRRAVTRVYETSQPGSLIHNRAKAAYDSLIQDSKPGAGKSGFSEKREVRAIVGGQ